LRGVDLFAIINIQQEKHKLVQGRQSI